LAKTSIRQAIFSGHRVVGPIALFIFPNTRARAVTLPSCLTPAGLERERVWGWERGRSDRRLEWRHGGLGALAGVLGCVSELRQYPSTSRWEELVALGRRQPYASPNTRGHPFFSRPINFKKNQ